jgi:hypothetical protein
MAEFSIDDAENGILFLEYQVCVCLDLTPSNGGDVLVF